MINHKGTRMEKITQIANHEFEKLRLNVSI